MISAFITIKDNIEEQCSVVAVVLYYAGIFMKSLDKRLLRTADKIGTPLICMSTGRLNLRYGGEISEIMEVIFRD